MALPITKATNSSMGLSEKSSDRNYAAGKPEFSIMIGLCIDGRPELGVVYSPAEQILWRARPGLSEKVNPDNSIEKLDISKRDLSKEGIILVTGHHHRNEFSDFIYKNLPAGQIKQKASVGLKMAMVAEGQADAYISSGKRIKLWDTYGPLVILREAGGVIQPLNALELVYTNEIQHGIEIVAATPHAYSWLTKSLKKVIEKWILLKNIRRN